MVGIKQCRACGSIKLTQFLDLGKQYLSDFRLDDSKPPKYPLKVVICDDCKLVQLKHSTPQKEMYHDNYGYKSSISQTLKDDLDDAVTHAFQYQNDPQSWLDIASNDGTLLSFVPPDVYRVGVDPVAFLCQEAQQYADLIINDYFTSDIGGEFDVITSISCFYDMPDPMQFVKDVKDVLAPHGIWLIQQNYLLTTMELSAVDNFCHEHLEYYTLYSLENLLNRAGLEVNEVALSTVNGGSIRTIVSRKGTYEIDESVQRQRDIEAAYGIDDLTTYKDFAQHAGNNLSQLRNLINDLKSKDKSIFILAASTRGATIWQSIDLTVNDTGFAVERNPAKVGKYFSALGIPIISELEAHSLNPDYLLVGPWFNIEEIIAREQAYLDAGGHLITPLPEVKII
jgi:NDP-4-keto-2,6-dideoxyhexose 3-C-methyltransferase